ncbi:MAG TPA: hypothetical protein VMP01_14180 [Pirellulaceae bacterium]|nr:hypothetical protein [Pirellulaceae bacterium]
MKSQFPATEGIHLERVTAPERIAAVIDKIPQLHAIASELFLGPVTMEVEEDPEIPGRQCVTISVEVSADLQDVANRRMEWYNHLDKLLGEECELVQIIVNVHD